MVHKFSQSLVNNQIIIRIIIQLLYTRQDQKGNLLAKMSRRNLSRCEISLLSKGLKFVSSANKIDRAKLKRELEEYGRKFCLMWHFRNDEEFFSTDKFRPKSSLNLRNKDAIIKTYLSFLEERLLDIEIPSQRYKDLFKEEHDALYSLRTDSSVIIKGAD